MSRCKLRGVDGENSGDNANGPVDGLQRNLLVAVMGMVIVVFAVMVVVVVVVLVIESDLELQNCKRNIFHFSFLEKNSVFLNC